MSSYFIAALPLSAPLGHAVAAAASGSGWRLQDTIAVVVGTATLATFFVAVVALRQTLAQVRSARESLEIVVRSIELSLAGELRTLNTNSFEQRQYVLRCFPLSVSFLERYPPWTWEVSADGHLLDRQQTAEVVAWLGETEHPAVRTWSHVGELSTKDMESANTVVGFLNDLCQMLADGTPGQYIFEQHHQAIIRLGAVVTPLVYVRQQSGRWGVRLPSLLNRAAIFHSVQPRDQVTTVKLQRVVNVPDREGLSGRLGVPAVIREAGRVELFIPLAGEDGTTGSLWYEDPPGRPTEVDYLAFRRYFEEWRPPPMAPIRLPVAERRRTRLLPRHDPKTTTSCVPSESEAAGSAPPALRTERSEQ